MTPHRQNVSSPDSSESNLHKRMRIINPASVAVERINFLFRQNGFYPIFSPSLETAVGINSKKIHFDREDIQKVDASNYPLMLYNRTPLVKSTRISGERVFQVVGPQNSLVNYTHGEFTLRAAAVFNSMEQLEEYETSFLLCGINAESLNIDATLPPIGILESLSSKDRKFILDLEWKDFSDLQIERNNGRYEFALGFNIQVLTSFFHISDPDTVKTFSTAQLNFYWDLELNHKESDWEFTPHDQVHVNYYTPTERTAYPYAAEIDPEYKKTDFVDTSIEILGFNPGGKEKEILDVDNLKLGSSISEATYSYTLNSDKYVMTGVGLTDIGGFKYRNIPTPFKAGFRRSYVNATQTLEYELIVDDRYSSDLSRIKVEIPIQYPVFYGMIDKVSLIQSKVKSDARNQNGYWSENLHLSYGSSTPGYFYYAYPSLFGKIAKSIFIPSEENLDMKLLTILTLKLISGKKTPRIPLEYYIYVSRDTIENPMSLLID